MGEDVRVTVIATGFDRSRVRRTGREDSRRVVRDRAPRVERPALQIADDDIDIPPFLRDN
jgi:hypothetical protein